MFPIGKIEKLNENKQNHAQQIQTKYGSSEPEKQNSFPQ